MPCLTCSSHIACIGEQTTWRKLFSTDTFTVPAIAKPVRVGAEQRRDHSREAGETPIAVVCHCIANARRCWQPSARKTPAPSNLQGIPKGGGGSHTALSKHSSDLHGRGIRKRFVVSHSLRTSRTHNCARRSMRDERASIRSMSGAAPCRLPIRKHSCRPSAIMRTIETKICSPGIGT